MKPLPANARQVTPRDESADLPVAETSASAVPSGAPFLFSFRYTSTEPSRSNGRTRVKAEQVSVQNGKLKRESSRRRGEP